MMGRFKIFTIGWEPFFINDLLSPIEKLTEIDFTHGIVGDKKRISFLKRKYPHMKVVSLSKTKTDPLPDPDYELLTSLECVGVPTVKSMIQGDRVLKNRSEKETFGYATLLVHRIKNELEIHKPNIVLGTFDSIHSGIGLAVSKLLGIPWVALAFSVIPENLTGFCNSLTPNSLVPITRSVDDEMRQYAKKIIKNVVSGNQKVMAYKAPVSIGQWLKQYSRHGINFTKRIVQSEKLGFDLFTAPTNKERLWDVTRRSINRIILPSGKMFTEPPKGRYAYYPFHMSPEAMVDTWAPFYQNQIAFIQQLYQAIPADMDLVVKLHFSDPDNYNRWELNKLLKLPRLRIAHPDASGRLFLEKSTLVIGIQGTTCIEAALRGKPVLIFGDSPYINFPRSERAKKPDQLYRQIKTMLEKDRPENEDIVEAFAIYMSRYMNGRINDWGQPISTEDFARLSECFINLKSYCTDPENYNLWYRSKPFVD